MAKDLLDRLAAGDILVHWGPIQTLLEQEKGRNLEVHQAEWIVDHPADFQDVLEAEFEAGTDLAYAGTQGNSRYRLRDFGLEDRLYELCHRQIQLAREVTPDNCYLAGAIGLSGRFLEPVGDITAGELYKSYAEQIPPMLEGGVDFFAVIDNDTEEIAIQIKAVRDHCNLPIMASHMFWPTKKGYRTLMGVDVKTACTKLQEAGADIIGAGCGGIDPIRDALGVVKEMRQGCDKPIFIKPDAGLAQLINGKIVQPVTPQEMAKEVLKWITAGASIVGGCCGTSLEHIKAISSAVKAVKR